MALNARRHTIPAGSDQTINRATIFETFGQSIRDVVPVASATDQDMLVSDMQAAGVGPSTSNPLLTVRGDAPGLHRIEFTTDGTTWIPASSVLQFTTLTDANTFAAAAPGLLTVGDRCRVAGADYEWDGAWYPVGMPAVLNAATVTTTANGANTPIDFDDPGNLPPGITWNESTKELIVNRAGRYRVTVTGRWQTNGTGYRVLQIFRNGVEVSGAAGAAVSGVEIRQTAVGAATLAAGDKIQINGVQTSGATIEFRGAQLTIERL